MLQGLNENPVSTFGHGGYGGSIGFADKSTGIAMSLVKKRMGGNITGEIRQTIMKTNFSFTAHLRLT